MGNQFVYTEKVTMPGVAEDLEKGTLATDPYEVEKKCSFNIDMVIRSITLDDGNLLVLLDDLHERQEERRKVNPKTGKVSIIKERNTFQSEITLKKDDAERFFNAVNIEY